MYSCLYFSLYLLKKYILTNVLYFICVCVCLHTSKSTAFLSEILEVKKKVESSVSTLESIADTVDEINSITGTESEYLAYEKELREFQRTLDEYENLGLDVKDFLEFKNHNPNSIRGQIKFFKNHLKQTKSLLKTFMSFTQSPESVTASEQIETNKTLRALLEDSQTRELRKLRREIANQKILLERRKQEQKFINEQYAYINRHSKRNGFGIFHPFQNKNELKAKKKRKKFLGIF